MPNPAAIIQFIPLVTAILWSIIIANQLRHKRYTLLQDRLFLGMAFALMIYCLVDPLVLYFIDPATQVGSVLLKIDLGSIPTFTVLILFVNKVYVSESGSTEHLLHREGVIDGANIFILILLGLDLVMIGTDQLIDGLRVIETWIGIDYHMVVYRSDLATIFFLPGLIFASLGCWYVYNLRKIILKFEATKAKGRQLTWLFWAFLLIIVFGLGSNTFNLAFEAGGLRPYTPPLLSSLLVIPTIIILAAFSQPTRTKNLTSQVIFALFKDRLPSSPFKIEELYLIATPRSGDESRIVERVGIRPQQRNEVRRRFLSAPEDQIRAAKRSITKQLAKGGPIKERSFGECSILARTGEQYTLALILTGRKNADLSEIMRLIVKWVEDRYHTTTAGSTTAITDEDRGAGSERTSDQDRHREYEALFADLFDDPALLMSPYELTLDDIKLNLSMIDQVMEELFASVTIDTMEDATIAADEIEEQRDKLQSQLGSAIETENTKLMTAVLDQTELMLGPLFRLLCASAPADRQRSITVAHETVGFYLQRAKQQLERLPNFTLQLITPRMVQNQQEPLAINITNIGGYELTGLSATIAPAHEKYSIGESAVYISSLMPGVTKRLYFEITPHVLRSFPVPVLVTFQSTADRQKRTITREVWIEAVADQTFTPISNPYSPGQPIEDTSMFFGRKRELGNIVDATTKPSKVDVLLIGDRRSGKTTMLKHLEWMLHEQVVIITIDTQTAQFRTTVHFLRFLLRSLPPAAVADAAEGIDIATESDAIILHEIVTDVIAALDTRVILLIDEGELLWEFGGDELLIMFRGLLQSSRDLACVMAGTRRLHDLKDSDDRFSPFFNAFLPIRIGALEKKDARALITEPIPVDFHEDSCESVLRLTGCNPYLLHSYGYHFVQAMNESCSYRVTLAMVEAATEQILKHEQHHLRWLWEQLDPPAQAVVRAVATTQRPVPLSHLVEVGDLTAESLPTGAALRATVSRLIDREVLFKTSAHETGSSALDNHPDHLEIGLKIGLLRRWLIEQLPLV